MIACVTSQFLPLPATARLSAITAKIHSRTAAASSGAKRSTWGGTRFPTTSESSSEVGMRPAIAKGSSNRIPEIATALRAAASKASSAIFCAFSIRSFIGSSSSLACLLLREFWQPVFLAQALKVFNERFNVVFEDFKAEPTILREDLNRFVVLVPDRVVYRVPRAGAERLQQGDFGVIGARVQFSSALRDRIVQVGRDFRENRVRRALVDLLQHVPGSPVLRESTERVFNRFRHLTQGREHVPERGNDSGRLPRHAEPVGAGENVHLPFEMLPLLALLPVHHAHRENGSDERTGNADQRLIFVDPPAAPIGKRESACLPRAPAAIERTTIAIQIATSKMGVSCFTRLPSLRRFPGAYK